ncbi:transmembrane protein, putative [Medicago truncatula]|uniref:Transmembrane protein, putative n=1 Tax=Medicago truncatula TaxID=3880 RepID=A0A072UJ89_MEDTR|nr:transmembrane protein, putative [Medicago truncatula]
MSGLKPVIDRLKSRLSNWKSRNLSFGGRLILLKYVLSSLPIYVISFFKAPSGKLFGGLRVRRLKEFNIALLGERAAYGWGQEGVGVVAGDCENSRGVGVEGGSWFEESIMKRVGEMRALGWGEEGEAWGGGIAC